MVLLRESGMTQPAIAAAIAAAMGVSLSTVNRAHMAYDRGGIKALKPKPNGGRKHENMTYRARHLAILLELSRRSKSPTLQRHDLTSSAIRRLWPLWNLDARGL
jgi:transposase